MLNFSDKKDKQIFEHFYNAHLAFAYHYAKEILGNSEEAEDVISESFQKVWEQFDQFKDIQNAKAFLIVITRNACLNRLKLEKRKQDREKVFADNTFPDQNDFEVKEIAAELFQYIYSEIEKLPLQEHIVFKMSFLDDKSNDEIAQLLQITNQSVRNNKARALKKLRKIFKGKKDLLFLLTLIITQHNSL